MVELKIALMVGLIGLLLLTGVLHRTSQSNVDMARRGKSPRQAWRRLVALTAPRGDVSALSRVRHSV
jgi:hypothetical protein